eukprot:Nitzschia sp. Nitz4//scaffold2_size372955//76566//81071//NITZ4_000380-RA/size372955-snap-gene-0.68-mRNA-1//-1//CDS//3329546647//3706//frame0
MADDLDYIETLDDVSNAIKLSRQQLDGADVPSLERGASLYALGDLPKQESEDANEEDSSKSNLRALLIAWESLVEVLFLHKVFLEYATTLDNCIATLSEVPPFDMLKVRDVVELMRETVEHHDHHSECAEMRYVTLLEVVLSYFPDWRPSTTISDAWEELELQIESDCKAAEFRRVAYKVLVQLPWVPTSYGLFLACDYEDSEAMEEELPERLVSKFDHIYGSPLLRADKVHQVLESISIEEPFTIVISYVPELDAPLVEGNGEGMGKSTLAALLAGHTTITQHYAPIWVDLDDVYANDDTKTITYQKYMEILRDICQQAGLEPSWPDIILRLEDKNVREEREKEHMMHAKDCLAGQLAGLEQPLLMVIDGAKGTPDFESFYFLEGQSSIVVSTTTDIPNVTCSVEIEGMGDDEAIVLFAREASIDHTLPALRTLEARSLFQLCLYHPLIIRTAAHWFKLKQVTSGVMKGLEELNLELAALKKSASIKADAFKALSEIMNLMLSPSTRQGGPATNALKLCFASACAVFGMEKVPLDSILALWSQLLTSHPEMMAEIGSDEDDKSEFSKRVWFIGETFIHLGLFSFSEEEGIIVVRLHHALYVKYGLSLIPELQPEGAKEDETIARWNSSFVTGYNMRLKVIKESTAKLKDMSRKYVLQKILLHMLNSRAIPRVLDMLKDDRFCRERLAKFGWIEGTRLHLDDCRLLKERAEQSKSASVAETQKVVISCLKKIAQILSEEPEIGDETRLEKGIALYHVGFMQASNNGIGDALSSYKNAIQLLPNSSHPFNAILMYSQAVLHLMKNDHDKANKRLKSCTKALKDVSGEQGSIADDLQVELVQLRGDSFAASCDYVGAETCYDEALELCSGESTSKLETGTALYRRARLHQTMGEIDQAIAALTACINWKLDISERSSRNLANAYSVAGDIYREFQEEEKALRQYQSSLETLEALGVENDDTDFLLVKGKVQLMSGNTAEGLRFFETARSCMKKNPKLLMDQSAYEFRVIGKMCVDHVGQDKGKEFYEEGVDLTMERPESLERACILFELGQCLFDSEETKECVVCLEEALKIRKAKLGDCELVLHTQITLGNVYRKLDLTAECLAASKDVMFLTEKLYRGDEAKSASALFGVAEAYEALDEYEESVSMFEECRELLKRSLGKDHPDVANVYQRLARIHTQHKNFDKAYSNYEEALEIGRANFELEDPQLGEQLYYLGNVSRRRGDFDKAREFLQEALTIFKNKEMAHETCLALVELGNVYRQTGDADTSVMCFERCMTFINEDDEDSALEEALQLSYGHAHLSRRHISEACSSFEIALRLRTERLGKDHRSTATASRSLGIAKYMSQSFAEARIYLGDFVRVSEVTQEAIGASSIDYILALFLLAEVNKSENRIMEAKHYWGKAKSALLDNSEAMERYPDLEGMLSHRLEKEQATVQETKSFFSRFTELARFEDEVSKELPVGEKLLEILRTHIFLDDET